VNGCKYLAPLTSYKPKQDHIKNSPAILKLHERGNEANKLGMIQLSNMIPVSDDVIIELDLSDQDEKYRKMMHKQLEYIKTQVAEISEKTEKLYKLVCVAKSPFYVKLSCDFAALEVALRAYVPPVKDK
jgi:protein AbiQ